MKMRASSILINTARGGLVDDGELALALKKGQIGGVGIDVFSEEPPVVPHAYSDLDNAILTPHMAGLSLECAERMAVASVNNILDFFNGNINPSLIVNANSL